MERTFIGGLLLAVLLSTWCVPARADAGDFVRVVEGQFVLGGAPFRFVGANASVIHGNNERREYESLLDAVRDDGLKVVRVWALGEQVAPGQAHYPLYAFRIGPDGWVEETFVQLDRVLVAARARGLRAILVLANRWKDYGGIGTYADWAAQPMPRDAIGETPATQLSGFYACARCDQLYRAHVTRVVGRVNSVSGVAYRDDPTILAWELINESSAVTARDEETLMAWTVAQARFIRSLDPNHLISAGHIGYGTSYERDVWSRMQALPEIDFADAHAYPLHDPRVSTPARLARWIDDRIAAASTLGKPLVFGEFGFERALAGKRAEWLRRFLSHAAAQGAAGALVWHYEPAANPRSSHSIHSDQTDEISYRSRLALREASRSFEAPLPRTRRALQPFSFTHSLRGTRRARDVWLTAEGTRFLDIDPLACSRAEFERVGIYREGVLDTLYGVGPGFVEYRFEAPRMLPRSLVVEARVSSELPGYALEPDPRDATDVQVEVDGEVIATLRTRPDDGLGDLIRAESVDARFLQRFARRAEHTLRFVALPSRYAGGLCLYGKPTGSQPLPPESQRAVDHVRIRLTP